MLAWNCKGAGSRYALRHLLLLIRNHNSDIWMLFETRVGSDQAQVVLSKSHFNGLCASEALGFAEGIWILWDKTKLDLELLSLDDQIITAVVHPIGSHPWILSSLYASPWWCFRQELWRYLILLGEIIQLRWLVMGDFNQILYDADKKGGRTSPMGPMVSFDHMLRHCALIDLGFSGPPFTWLNMRKRVANIQECLDRALGNRQWIVRFGTARVSHLPRSQSNHHPFLLQDSNLPSQPTLKLFQV